MAKRKKQIRRQAQVWPMSSAEYAKKIKAVEIVAELNNYLKNVRVEFRDRRLVLTYLNPEGEVSEIRIYGESGSLVRTFRIVRSYDHTQ